MSVSTSLKTTVKTKRYEATQGARPQHRNREK